MYRKYLSKVPKIAISGLTSLAPISIRGGIYPLPICYKEKINAHPPATSEPLAATRGQKGSKSNQGTAITNGQTKMRQGMQSSLLPSVQGSVHGHEAPRWKKRSRPFSLLLPT